MKDVAEFVIKFRSPSGECSAELEEKFEEFERNLQWWAKQVCNEETGLIVEIEEQ